MRSLILLGLAVTFLLGGIGCATSRPHILNYEIAKSQNTLRANNYTCRWELVVSDARTTNDIARTTMFASWAGIDEDKYLIALNSDLTSITNDYSCRDTRYNFALNKVPPGPILPSPHSSYATADKITGEIDEINFICSFRIDIDEDALYVPILVSIFSDGRSAMWVGESVGHGIVLERVPSKNSDDAE